MFDRLPVEILSVGNWNGRDYTLQDLQDIVRNFHRLSRLVKPPLKFGHDDDQRLIGQSDGDPALGWVSGLALRGDKLIAEFSDMPPIVQRAIEKRLYRRVSSEIAVGAQLDGEPVGMVLTGVALLGSDLPAVGNLADLQAYLGDAEQVSNALARCGRVRLTYAPSGLHHSGPGDKEAKAMEETTVRGGFTGRAGATEALMESVERLTETIGAAGAKGEQADPKVHEALKAEMAKLREARRVERFEHLRSALSAKLDERVKAKTLLPATREKIDGLVLGQKERFTERLAFSGEELLSILETMKPVTIVDKEQLLAGSTAGMADASGTGASLDDDPAVQVAQQVHAQMLKNPALTFQAATRLVLDSDPELARAYSESRAHMVDLGAFQLRRARS